MAWVKAIKAVHTEALKDDWMVVSQQMDMDLIEKMQLEENQSTQSGFEWAYEETKLMQLMATGECIMSIDKQIGDSQEYGQTPNATENTVIENMEDERFGITAMSILKYNKSATEHPRLHYSALLRVTYA